MIFKCPFCPRTFRTEAKLERHMGEERGSPRTRRNLSLIDRIRYYGRP